MKKLLLLSALLIFACSSDSSHSDDNDLMEETFLEKYDGVVWESDEWASINDTGVWRYIIFNDASDFLTIVTDDNIIECVNIYEFSNEEGYISISANSENNFVFNWAEIDSETEDVDTITITAINNGNNIEWLSTIYGLTSFTRTNISTPCD
tara:strand:+ start:53 stop:508 length:456 start_codon:yes stop_codon:yes gene_type:complete